MKVAIIGGNGFIGKELISLMKNKSWIPVIFTRKNTLNVNCEYITTDYTQDDINSKLIDFDAVVILAAVRGSNGKISNFHENEILVQNILEACIKNNIDNICYASSISVYSEITEIPWKEENIPVPKTLYGISKLACEHIGTIYAKKYNLKFKSLRFAHILGEGEIKGYMMNTFIDNAFHKKTLTINGESIAKREFIYVKDVAEAICIAIQDNDISGCFNIGSGVAYTNYEIATIVNEVFGNEGNLQYNDNLPEEIESSLMDIRYAKDKLGYYPKYSFREALEDIKRIKEL